MKLPIKNIFALKPSQEQKAILCQRVSKSFENGRDKGVQINKQIDIFVFI